MIWIDNILLAMCLQADYHNLIGITADLVDALEQTVQGKTVSETSLVYRTHVAIFMDFCVSQCRNELFFH